MPNLLPQHLSEEDSGGPHTIHPQISKIGDVGQIQRDQSTTVYGGLYKSTKSMCSEQAAIYYE